jgi:hypothetical protein
VLCEGELRERAGALFIAGARVHRAPRPCVGGEGAEATDWWRGVMLPLVLEVVSDFGGMWASGAGENWHARLVRVSMPTAR